MSIEVAAATAASAVATSATAHYHFSLTELADYQAAMERAHQHAASAPRNVLGAEGPSPALLSMMAPLEQVNLQAANLSAVADAAAAEARELTPGEMIMLTVRCHEFLFHCQLTSNIANRTSDGIQQLFRQQS